MGSHSTLRIQSPFSLKKMKIGDSIAVNGCCLSATRVKGKTFLADLSPETLKKTNLGELKVGHPVNLELPLRLQDRLDGHIVQGHVDGVGKILRRDEKKIAGKKYFFFKIRVPKPLLPYMVNKGSIAVDGISLTVNEVGNDTISLCIIPHTLKITNLAEKNAGDKVNLEADIVLKYLEKVIKKGG